MKTATSILVAVLLASCDDPKPKQEKNWDNEQSTRLNKELAIQENIDIKLYLARHENWKVEETGSGLRYILLKQTEGKLAASGNEAKVSYNVTLLNGSEIYETGTDELDVFQIDHSDIETGLQEGIKKMRVGEEAKLIIPSHIAHGLVGDLNKIPPLATLVVTIKLVELK